jgi:hypothetical protein
MLRIQPKPIGRAASIALCLPLLVASTVVTPADAALATDPSLTMTIPVTNCDDGGPGSLRDAIARSISGDTIDMRALRCQRILVLAGPIQIPRRDLTLLGPGRALLIDGNGERSVLRHGGTGTLLIRGLSVGYGYNHTDRALGGCIGSEGNVLLQNVSVHDCRVFNLDLPVRTFASGGGVYAARSLTVVDSDVYANSAVGGSGGGLYALGLMTLRRSRIFDNNARRGIAGGVFAFGGLRAFYSEISDNYAESIGGIRAGQSSTISHSAILRNRGFTANGGAFLEGEDRNMLVIDSTISGNSAPWRAGLTMIGARTPKAVVNSTIVYNREHPSFTSCAGALYIQDVVHLESSIVAKNLCFEQPVDIAVAQIEGGNNLIESSTVPVPPDTISADPRLAPLAYNGGPTRTRALLADSPAIDMGNNVAGLKYDQRGPGFPRVKGPRADIGAFEY